MNLDDERASRIFTLIGLFATLAFFAGVIIVSLLIV